MNRETHCSNAGEADQNNSNSLLVPTQSMFTNNDNNNNVTNNNFRCQRIEGDINPGFLPPEPVEIIDELIRPIARKRNKKMGEDRDEFPSPDALRPAPHKMN